MIIYILNTIIFHSTTFIEKNIRSLAVDTNTLFTPPCTLNSWTDRKPKVWTACCYQDDMTATHDCMRQKPREITKV